MRPLSFAQAASRADSALCRVVVTVKCPECGQPVRCVVDATEVEITASCPLRCDAEWSYVRERITEDARERAQGERDEYRQHIMGGGV